MSESAGAWVRTLRTEVPLTQEQLAEFCGVSARTIREIESGRIQRPRADTLERIARVLGLSRPDTDRFLEAWRDGWRGRDDRVLFQRSVNLADLVSEQHQRQRELSRQIAHFHQVVIGADRVLERLSKRFVIEAIGDGLDRQLQLISPVPAGADPGLVQVRRCQNCRPGEIRMLASERIIAVEIEFGRALMSGDRHSFDYEIDLSALNRAPGSSPAPETETLVGFRGPGPTLVMRAAFTAPAIPVAVRRIEAPKMDQDATVREPLELTAFQMAEISVDRPAPGGHGIQWEWPD